MDQVTQGETGDHLTGTINWLDTFSGIGFICSPKVEGDIFVLQSHGLSEGQEVEFTLVSTESGFKSEKVRPVLAM